MSKKIKMKYKDRNKMVVDEKNIDFKVEKNKKILNLAYELTISLPDRYFLIGIFEYMGLFDRNDLFFKTIQKVVIKLAKIDHEPLDNLKQKALVEINQIFNEVSDYVSKNNILDDFVKNDIQSFNDLKSGKAMSTGDFNAMDNYLYSLLNRLVEQKNHIVFLSKLGSFDKNGKLKKWTFDQELTKFNTEKDRINRLQWTKVWFYWDKLALIENIYKYYERYRADLIKKAQWLTLSGYSDIYREIISILEDKKSTGNYVDNYYKFIDLKEYREYFKLLHYYITNLVDEFFHNKLTQDIQTPTISTNTTSQNFSAPYGEIFTRDISNIDLEKNKSIIIENETKREISKKKPECVIENHKGYLKLHKYSEKIEITPVKRIEYKLINYMVDKLNRDIDVKLVFEQIRTSKHREELSKIASYDKELTFMANVVSNAIKNIQKLSTLKNIVDLQRLPSEKNFRRLKMSIYNS